MPTRPLSDAECIAALDARDAHPTQLAAAEALGLNRATFQSRLRTAELRFPERKSERPMIVTGRSTLRDLRTGEAVMEWEKTSLDRQASLDALHAAAEAMASDLPRLPPLAPPATSLAALVTVYVLTDFHLGCLAWHKEGGADWDVAIAERTGLGAMEALSSASPASEEGLVVIQGDFTHADGLTAMTPTSGHILDADSRFGKVADIAIRMIRRMVDLALLKHQRVRLIVCEGNHDIITSLWLRKLFACLYENEPRVTVEDSELPYYAYRFGKVMLAFHHGHLKKNDQLPLLFAAQFSRMWGETTKRYCHTGHRHHVEEKEHSGMTVLQHPTLAARDAYAARGGWISERAAQAITYHSEFGQVGRVMVSPEMIA